VGEPEKPPSAPSAERLKQAAALHRRIRLRDCEPGVCDEEYTDADCMEDVTTLALALEEAAGERDERFIARTQELIRSEAAVEAAGDVADRLSAEVESLRKERDDLRGQVMRAQDENASLKADLKTARVDVDRLLTQGYTLDGRVADLSQRLHEASFRAKDAEAALEAARAEATKAERERDEAQQQAFWEALALTHCKEELEAARAGWTRTQCPCGNPGCYTDRSALTARCSWMGTCCSVDGARRCSRESSRTSSWGRALRGGEKEPGTHESGNP
jgi:chromosome segregation ATPase